jgi:hypothetical protein
MDKPSVFFADVMPAGVIPADVISADVIAASYGDSYTIPNEMLL